MDGRRPSLRDTEDVHEMTPSTIFLLGSNMINTHTKDEDTDSVIFLDEFESQQINNKQFRRQKPRVLLHIFFFSLIVGIIITSSVLFPPHSRNRESSAEKTPLPSGGTTELSTARWPVPAYSNFTDREAQTLTIKTGQFPENENRDLKISSAQDFKLLKPFHKSVDILGIDEGYEHDFPFFSPIGDNVKSIKISGPITPQWFYFVMRKFPSALSLTIDLDKFCSSGTSFKNIMDRVIAFESVEKYVITNFKRCNSNISGFFLSLNFPSLKYFVIEDSSLTSERYAILAKFLKSNAKLLHSVKFHRCFICEQCKIFDIEYPGADVEIFERRRTPLIK